jgi:hypothetical protein
MVSVQGQVSDGYDLLGNGRSNVGDVSCSCLLTDSDERAVVENDLKIGTVFPMKLCLLDVGVTEIVNISNLNGIVVLGHCMIEASNPHCESTLIQDRERETLLLGWLSGIGEGDDVFFFCHTSTDLPLSINVWM